MRKKLELMLIITMIAIIFFLLGQVSVMRKKIFQLKSERSYKKTKSEYKNRLPHFTTDEPKITLTSQTEIIKNTNKQTTKEIYNFPQSSLNINPHLTFANMYDKTRNNHYLNQNYFATPEVIADPETEFRACLLGQEKCEIVDETRIGWNVIPRDVYKRVIVNDKLHTSSEY